MLPFVSVNVRGRYGQRREGLSEVSASSKQWSPSFFQTAGKLRTLVAPFHMLAETTQLCEMF